MEDQPQISVGALSQRAAAGGIRVRPLNAPMGAVIDGVDLSERLSPADREAILSAVLQHKLVLFQDQAMTSEQHAAFAEHFGELYLHPTTERHPTATTLQKIRPPDPSKLARIKAAAGARQISAGYHADTSWRLAPAWAGVLRPVRLPPSGGETIWVDAELALQALDDDVKRRLRDLHVTHDFSHALRPLGLDYPLVAHPIIQPRAATQREVLWVNFAARPRIVGLDEQESHGLLSAVLEQYEKPEHQFRLSWRMGTVAFWDNRSTVHLAVHNYGDFPRLLERALIVDRPAYLTL
jgi:alpha-ketoglutarate-dependent taurine dioxygenase